MKATIISSRQIAECPLHILSPAHWIPEHRTEECDPELQTILKDALVQVEELEKRQAAGREKLKENIREMIRHSIIIKEGEANA